MPDALRDFLDRVGEIGSASTLKGTVLPTRAPAPLPDGAQFLAKTYANTAGSRPYKVYVPSCYDGKPLPLIVMLHGCTQSPDDFAAGTRMNVLAEEHACLIAYPGQTQSANSSKCWNWFSPQDQRRDQGEPSLIAGITRQIMSDYAVDHDASTLLASRQEVPRPASWVRSTPTSMPPLACILVSPVGPPATFLLPLPPCGKARQGQQAFGGTRHENRCRRSSSMATATKRCIRSMATRLLFIPGQAEPTSTSVRHGRVLRGIGYSCTVYANGSDNPLVGTLALHGVGHAWSGGSPDGSYTEPRGPDASREMLRFFLEHPKSASNEL